MCVYVCVYVCVCGYVHGWVGVHVWVGEFLIFLVKLYYFTVEIITMKRCYVFVVFYRMKEERQQGEYHLPSERYHNHH